MLRHTVVLTGLLGVAGCFGDDCPDDYGFNDDLGSCYRLVDNRARSWQDAEASCESESHDGISGHLAVIDSDAERDFMNREMVETGGYWIGASDVAQEGIFVWVTGEPVTRDDWGYGEPNNDFGSEDCVEYRAGVTDLLNDRTCSTPMDFVCEWDGL
jgi:hypothetical protein